MEQAFAYSTVGLTLGLVVARPRIRFGPLGASRLSPALAAAAGVALLLCFGVVEAGAAAFALADLWRSFVTLAAIMVMTDVAHRIGVLDWLAAAIDRRARTAAGLFAAVFTLSAATAAVINNDAAILLLTPLVVTLVQRRSRSDLVIPTAFAVFIAAGVAPMVVSNPMNMIVADYADIGFNEYAARMLPVAIPGWLIGYLVLRLLFRRRLTGGERPGAAPPAAPLTRPQLALMAILAAALPAYSLVSYLGGPVWVIACGCAALALALAARAGARPGRVIREGVSWNTLAFLFCVLILALGLANVGLVGHLAGLYDGGSLTQIGVSSALGSAVLNNHPMAYLNMLALDPGAGHGTTEILAALIGGDLGPRLLPMGSLAGLLWLEALRRRGVHIGLGRFVAVGFAVTVPTLAASLAVLSLLG